MSIRRSSPWVAALLVLASGTSQGQAPAQPGLPVGGPPPLASTSSGSLSLEEVLRSVQAHHPQLEVARQTIQAAEGQLLSARGGFDTNWKTKAETTPEGYYVRRNLESVVEQPTPLWGTRLLAGYRLGTGNFPVYYGEYETLRAGEFRAGVEVPLWRGGPIDKRRAELAKARLNLEATGFVVGTELLELQREASSVYWSWVAAGRQLSISRELLELARLRNQQLKTRVERGDIARIEQTENERALRVREADLVAARRKLEQSALKLGLYLRTDEGKPLPPDPERLPEALPQPELEPVGEAEKWVSLALENRPELREQALQRRMAQVEVAYATNQIAPAIDVGVYVSRDVGAGPERLRPTEVQAGLKLDIPLQARVARGQRNAAVAKQVAIDSKLRLLQDKVVLGVYDALSALDAAAERLALAREARAIARELAQAEAKQFELGNTTLLLVNLREELAANAELSEVKALADYQLALVDLRVAAGMTALELPAAR